MNCIKPSGPYIAFLVIIFTVSFIGIPKQEQNKTTDSTQFLTYSNAKQGKLKEIENISMLNSVDYE